MKPRHAAALALVGWYLMMPPHENVSSDGAHLAYLIDPNTPLRKWLRVPGSQEFEYKTDCERAISNGCHREVNADGSSYLDGLLCNTDADCIASDDPRLKESK